MAKASSEIGNLMLTATKIAQKLGVSSAKVRKIIKDEGIKANLVKGGCSYYSEATTERIKKSLAPDNRKR